VVARILGVGGWHGRCSRRTVMKPANELAMDQNDDDLSGGWFEESEVAAVSQAEPYYEESGDRPSRVGLVIAGVSATALTLVIVFAGRI